MRIALISAPLDDTRYRSGESLGLKYLAAEVTARGHEVDLYEMDLSGISLPSLCERLKERDHDVIGFGALFTRSLPATIELANSVRKINSRAHFTIGGQATSFVWNEILASSDALNSCVCFEADQTFPDLIDEIAREHPDFKNVPGLYFRHGSEVYFSGFRSPVVDLDALPFPTRDSNSFVLGDPHVMMLSSRGCSAHCTFCSSGNFGNRYHKMPRWRPRSVPSLIDEIDWLVQNKDVRAISFVDDDFLGACPEGPPRALAFVNALRRLPYSIKWSIECRVDEVSLPLFQAMCSVGLEHVLIGIDAGNEADLRLFGKAASLTQAEQAVYVLRSLNLSFNVGFIMFHPDTSLEKVRANLSFMRRNNLGQVANILNKLELYRGSPLVTLFSRSNRLRMEHFEYSFDFQSPDVDVLHKVLWESLEPFRGHERLVARARFAAQTGIGSGASDRLRDELNAHEQRVGGCELNIADHALSLIEEQLPSSLSDSFKEGLAHSLQVSATEIVKGLDADLAALTHGASER